MTYGRRNEKDHHLRFTPFQHHSLSALTPGTMEKEGKERVEGKKDKKGREVEGREERRWGRFKRLEEKGRYKEVMRKVIEKSKGEKQGRGEETGMEAGMRKGK